MFLSFSTLQENPFRITPDPRYLFLSERHARAKSYMESTGFLTDGFVAITGEVGTGKTILVNDFLTHSRPDVTIVKIHQTQISPVQFLQAFLAELGFKPFNKKKAELLNMANTFLRRNHSAGMRTVLIIDEAQHLSMSVLEEIRLLAEIEEGDKRILNVILAGQPGFKDSLFSPRMEQLAQRTPLHFHLLPLNAAESRQYVLHRLKIAGDATGNIFKPDSFELIHRHTKGIPRLINSLCNTAVLCAFADDLTFVSRETVITALAELQWRPGDVIHDEQSSTLPTEARPLAEAEKGTALDQQKWAELEKTTNDQKRVIGRLQSSLEAKVAKIEALEGEIGRLQKARAPASNGHAEPASSDSETMVLSETINALRAKFDAARKRRSQLDVRLGEEESTNKQLAAELRSKQQQIDAYKRDLKEPDHTPADASNRHDIKQESMPESPAEPRPPPITYAGRELVALNGSESSAHAIKAGQLSLGSGADNDIRIVSSFISAHHAEIISNSQGSILGDLNSANGTFVNTKRIRRHALRDGDSITIGKHRFRYVSRVTETSSNSEDTEKANNKH